jgi:hypothetical protein
MRTSFVNAAYEYSNFENMIIILSIGQADEGNLQKAHYFIQRVAVFKTNIPTAILEVSKNFQK